MGIDLILFYAWWIFSVTVLFYVLIKIFEYFVPKVGNLIDKLKNYFKGGVL